MKQNNVILITYLEMLPILQYLSEKYEENFLNKFRIHNESSTTIENNNK